MTGIKLIDSIKIELSLILRDYTLPNKNNVLQLVKIFTQYFPLPDSVTLTNKAIGTKNYDESDYDANFPCVLIRYENEIDNEERSLELTVHNISLLFGVYSEEKDCQAWRELLLMMDKVKQHFFVTRVLYRRYRLTMPVKSHLLEVDTWPVYYGQIDMTFESGRSTQPALFVHRRHEK